MGFSENEKNKDDDTQIESVSTTITRIELRKTHKLVVQQAELEKNILERDRSMNTRLTARERRMLDTAAKLAGVSPSDYLRKALIGYVGQDLEGLVL